jgi:hypothetical protein
MLAKLLDFIIFFFLFLKHQNALALSTLRIYNNGLRQPHFHFNANEMGYVLSGCGKVISQKTFFELSLMQKEANGKNFFTLVQS